MRRLLVSIVLGLSLAAPGTALADDTSGSQDVAFGQASQSTATALSVVTIDSGGTCFAGCPTIVVAPTTAVALSLNVGTVAQLLNQIGVRP